MTEYGYTKTPVSVDRLTVEIKASAIIIALDHITTFGSALSIFFKADLSEGDQAILDGLVAAHDGTPLSQNFVQNVAVQSQPAVSIASAPPYSSKNITVNGVTKKLYARFTGVQFSLSQGTNTLTYTATYTWAKLLGVEVINAEALDTADLKVYDTAAGTYSGVPNALLNQFSYTLNLPKDFYTRMAQFDADLYVGMIIQITYVSKSAKDIGLNLLLNEVKS
jgi:hypothetical protein